MKNIYKNTLLYAGLLIAFLLVLTCLQLYVDTNKLFGSKSSDANYWLVFSKKITPDNIGRKELLGFNDADIDTIHTWGEVDKIYPFSSNEFKASANGGDFIPFYTDLYFEAVDLEALDVPLTPEEFQVKDGVIPIVISREYLNLYNYGFALNQGLPQISEDFAKKIELNVGIVIQKENRTYKAKLVGLSDRIHSILVPKEFLDSINIVAKPESAHQRKTYNRLLIKIKDANDKNLVSKMQAHGYESNQEGLRSAKIKGQVYMVLQCIIVLGVFIFLLCLYMIINVIKITFLEQQEEVSIRNTLGYSPLEMVANISKQFSIKIAVVLFICLILVSLAQYLLASSSIANATLSLFIHPALLGLCVVLPFLIYFLVKRMIYKWLLRSWVI